MPAFGRILQLARMEEMDCEFVEVTAHEGARPTHAVWQGRVYHRGGAVVQDGERYEDFEAATGYGTGPGLCGWNCRHNFYPFYPGVSVRNYTDERLAELDARNIPYGGGLYTKYEITQMQRALERRVRKYKRRYLAETAAGVDASQSAAKLKAARYKEITIQSIQHIQPFACETLDAAGSCALANAHKRLLLEARKVPLGTEKARYYGLDMQPLSKIIISGQQGRVRIPDQDVPYIAAHTHPSGLTFSPSDIRRFALRENMRMLTAVGNDGTVYAIEKTAPFDRSGLLALFRDSEIRLAAAKDPKELQEIMQQLLKEAKQYGANFYAGRDR